MKAETKLYPCIRLADRSNTRERGFGELLGPRSRDSSPTLPIRTGCVQLWFGRMWPWLLLVAAAIVLHMTILVQLGITALSNDGLNGL